MPHALQVSFRQLVPNEALIALARETYSQIRRARPGLGECSVLLEARSGDLTHAFVRVRSDDGCDVEGHASHGQAEAALGLALTTVQAQLDAMPARDSSTRVTGPAIARHLHKAAPTRLSRHAG